MAITPWGQPGQQLHGAAGIFQRKGAAFFCGQRVHSDGHAWVGGGKLGLIGGLQLACCLADGRQRVRLCGQCGCGVGGDDIVSAAAV